MTSAVGLLEQTHVGVKVWLEYVYLKYSPGTFYVIGRLKCLGTYEWVRFLFQSLFLISLRNPTCRFFFSV